CKINGSTAIDETVFISVFLRLCFGINPVRSSSDKLSKDDKKFVFPLFDPLLINKIPIKIEQITPTVADVIAKDVASSQPLLPNVSPIAAAVPCPPTNPAANINPNPACISLQNGLINSRANPSPAPHIKIITI